MQKKILASLLMVPMAYSAFANINIDVDVKVPAWDFNGIQGSLNYDEATQTFESLNVGVGQISQKLDLPFGDYVLSFGNSENVKIIVNGKTLENENGVYNFTVDTAGKTNLVIGAEDPSDNFKFTGLDLDVVCDFQAIANELRPAFNDLKLDVIVPDANDTAEANRLRDLKKELDKQKTAIRDRILALEQPANQTLETYKKEELWANPNKIAADIAALQAKVDEYNAAVTAENTRYAAEQTNIANQAALAADVTALQTRLANIAAKIKDNTLTDNTPVVNDYVANTTKSDFTSNANNISALATLVDELKENPNFKGDNASLIDVAGLQATVADISTALTALDSDVDAAIADLNAYLAAMKLNEDLTTAYDTAATTISGLKGIKGYETVPFFYTAEMQQAIADLYNQTLEDLEIKQDDVFGANDKLQHDTDLINAAIPALKAKSDEAVAKVTTQNNLMTDDLAAIGAFTARVTKINGFAKWRSQDFP